MKVWKGYGSGHSARLTIVGEFTSESDASQMRNLVDDFVNGIQNEKYTSIEEFWDAWKESPQVDKEFANMIRYLGATSNDFEMGLDDNVDVVHSGTTVTVDGFRTNAVGGVIKLMLCKYPTSVTVTGQTGP